MFEVRAEMVANVWKHEAKVGDVVAEGDVLAVLESMKMEIPVFAEVAGRVTSLNAPVGSIVQEGDVVAVIDETG